MAPSIDEGALTFPSRIPKARKGPGRPSGRFTQHHRIDRLRELLESEPRGLTLDTLASILRITQRSVRRYLEALQGTTELESIATAPGAAHVWRIKPSERGRAVHSAAPRPTRSSRGASRSTSSAARRSTTSSTSRSAASRSSRRRRSAAAARRRSPARTSSRRASSSCPTRRGATARAARSLDELFRARSPTSASCATARARARAGEPRAERVDFLPYAMLAHRGAIVLVGARRQTPELFEVVPLETMTEVRTSETERFTLPEDFAVSDYVHGEFGVAPPTRAVATVEFEARVADELRTRRLHPRQRSPAPKGASACRSRS